MPLKLLTEPIESAPDGYGSVYLATNLINGKVYVGKTERSVKERWSEHVGDTISGSDYYFHRAIRKHKVASFRITILEICLLDQLKIRESYWISLYESANPDKGYNCTGGGDGVDFTPEVRERHRKATQSPEFREQASKNSKKMWENTDFRTRRLEDMAELRKNPEYVANHLTAVNRPEYRAGISRRNKILAQDPEYTAKLSRVHKDRINKIKVLDPEAWEAEKNKRAEGLRNPEVSAKMSENAGARVARKREEDPDYYFRLAKERVAKIKERDPSYYSNRARASATKKKAENPEKWAEEQKKRVEASITAKARKKAEREQKVLAC